MGSNARDNTYKNLLYSIHLLAPARAFPQPMIQKEMPRQRRSISYPADFSRIERRHYSIN